MNVKQLSVIPGFLILIAMLAGFSGRAAALEIGKFYTIAPSAASTDLMGINPYTGEVTHELTLTLAGGGAPHFMTNSIAFSPDGTLYGWDTSPDKRQLYSIDTLTGVVTYIGASNYPGNPQWMNGLAFDKDGNLYGLRGGGAGTLYAINTVTSAATQIGNLGVEVRHNGLAIDFMNNELYLLTGLNTMSNDMIYKLDKTSGAITETHTLNFGYRNDVGVEFDLMTGDLYALRGGSNLMLIDMENGTETLKYTLSGVVSTNLAAMWPTSAPVPEPATLPLLGVGIIGLALNRSHRARKNGKKEPIAIRPELL